MRSDEVLTVSMDKETARRLRDLAELVGGNRSLAVRRLIVAADPEALRPREIRPEVQVTPKG